MMQEVEMMKRIKKAVRILKKGGLVIYPTESSYAIGADGTNEEAVRQVYEVKKRPLEKKLNVIVPSLKAAMKYCYLSDLEIIFYNLLYPKTLTLIAKKKENVPDILNTEFAFRVPSALIPLELARMFGKPITATSANISGQEPIYDAEKLYQVFGGTVDYILDIGNLEKRPVSSIVRLYRGELEIIRESSISREELEKAYKKAKEMLERTKRS